MKRPAWAARAARRRTIRLRLTLIYSGLFLLAAAMLLAFTYVFVVRGLSTTSACAGPAARVGGRGADATKGRVQQGDSCTKPRRR